MGERGTTDAAVPSRHWHRLDDGRIACTLCPRLCKLKEGEHGLCRVRARRGGRIVLTTHGRSCGFRLDPIERLPLYHFLPGTPALAVGTAGDNLACRFDPKGSRSGTRASELPCATPPAAVARSARELGCATVAFALSEPVVAHEYAVEVARACRAAGLRTAAVTAGYVCPEPRAELFRHVDAAVVALKAFSERFYWKHCGGHLGPVLDTILDLGRESGVWLELTAVLVPGENDSVGELERMSRWIVAELGPDVPLHLRPYRPGWTRPGERPGSAGMLARAREVARGNGVRHVYADESSAAEDRGTRCERCGALLIGRDWHLITDWNLTADGRCRGCGAPCPGVFEPRPDVLFEREPVGIDRRRTGAGARPAEPIRRPWRHRETESAGGRRESGPEIYEGEELCGSRTS